MFSRPRLADDSQYYIYKHVCPETSELLYIGCGTNQRAWMSRGGYDTTKYGHRSPEHSEYLNELMAHGYVPSDWVHIIKRGLPRKDAYRIEHDLIWELKPRFNRLNGHQTLRMTPEMVAQALALREQGASYMTISEELGIAHTTVYRALTGQTRNLLEFL